MTLTPSSPADVIRLCWGRTSARAGRKSPISTITSSGRCSAAGETLSYKDQQLTLHRPGRPDQGLDEPRLFADPRGRRHAHRRDRDRRRDDRQGHRRSPPWRRAVAAAADVRAVAEPDGPAGRARAHDRARERGIPAAHRPARRAGQRPSREALPDAVERGYLDLLDKVFRSGEAIVTSGSKYVVRQPPAGPSGRALRRFRVPADHGRRRAGHQHLRRGRRRHRARGRAGDHRRQRSPVPHLRAVHAEPCLDRAAQRRARLVQRARLRVLRAGPRGAGGAGLGEHRSSR